MYGDRTPVIPEKECPGTYKVCMKECPDNFFTFLDMATDPETQQLIMVRNSKNDQFIPNLFPEKLFFGFFKNFQWMIDPGLGQESPDWPWMFPG